MLATGNLTLNHVLAHRAEVDADRIALIFESTDGRWTELSYGDLHERAGRLAAGLARSGVGKGDHVVLHMVNRPEFVVGLFAIARLGAIATPTIASYAIDELQYVLEHAEVASIICDPGRLEVATQAAKLSSGKTPEVICTDDLATYMRDDEPPAVDVAASDPAVLMYSSGTTARPKGVVLSHQALVLSGEVNAQHQRLRPDDRSLCVLPLFHINAMSLSLLCAVVTGSTLVLAEAFDATRYWAQVRTYGITVGSLVANPIRQLMQLPEQSRDARHSLRMMLFGMALADAEIDEFERRYAVPLINLWGMTEDATIGTRCPPYLPRNPRSIGLPQTGIDIAVFDAEDREVPAGQPGEARYIGSPRLEEYYRDPDITAATNRDGRFCTGDTMMMDELGYFYFLDRTKDVIKVKAENVASAEVERVLTTHQAVSDAAVVGVPDTWRDERIVAFVQVVPGQSVDAEELRAHCLDSLARFKVPHEVHFVDEFPRTSIGKIRKNELRDKAKDGQG
ncbi:class I adenylate-forming enzyme family protein [Cumulibacter manganitolerans]|uniref:class I adenylate-forming enzyme family protein n=1 Tax=Cumulibacter manganitolerans TaxID=1884992 RepID=UPI001886280C|nr:AMP-binding protein [Cumulibacter manganitolerans]